MGQRKGSGVTRAYEEAATTRRALLDGINDRHQRDTSAPLTRLRTAAKGKYVPGVGNPLAPVLFVGEAPGASEHRTGQPFAGASGRVFDDLLASIRMPRRNVYVTNAVHYRPVDISGHSRTPEVAEVVASKPYLLQEIEVVQPYLVVTLGRVPMFALLGEGLSIGACHGMLHNAERTGIGRPVLTLHHPSVGVYQQAQKPVLRRDFAQIDTYLRHEEGVSW